MKRVKQIVPVLCMLYVLSLPVIAGDMQTTVIEPSPSPTPTAMTNGDMQTTVDGSDVNPMVEVVLNIVNSLLV